MGQFLKQAGQTCQAGLGLQMFTNDDLLSIHYATLDVMRNTGIKVRGEKAREIFASGGAIIEGDIVKFTPNMVEDAIRSAPRTILLAGREEKNDYQILEKSVGFTNFGEALRVVDPETGIAHDSTKKDLGDCARICDALENVTVFERALGSDDVPGKVMTIHNAEAIFNNTSKHAFMHANDTYSAKKIIEIASVIAGSEEKLRDRPIFTFNCCPNSPLTLNPDCTDAMYELASRGLSINCISVAMAGGTAPVTLAGTLVIHNAEVLSGIVFTQLVRRGTTVIYGSSTTGMDLRTMVATIGTPEKGLINAGVAQLAHFYGLPCFVGSG